MVTGQGADYTVANMLHGFLLAGKAEMSLAVVTSKRVDTDTAVAILPGSRTRMICLAFLALVSPNNCRSRLVSGSVAHPAFPAA